MRKEFYEEIMKKFLSYGVEFMSYADESEWVMWEICLVWARFSCTSTVKKLRFLAARVSNQELEHLDKMSYPY